MISQIKQKGFTIVELLIVIVIIAILAAISMAAYTNITARANTSSAQAAAKTVKDTIQNFQGAHGAWPSGKAALVRGAPSTSATDMANAVAKLPTDIEFITAAPTASSAPKQVVVESNTVAGNIVGYRITWRNFAGGTNEYMQVGEIGGGTLTALTNAS